MNAHRHDGRSQLFTLRVWPEEVDGNLEWRGKVQHVADGETLYFRDWEAMLAFLRQTLDVAVSKREQEEPKK